jgi:hypothetical protein
MIRKSGGGLVRASSVFVTPFHDISAARDEPLLGYGSASGGSYNSEALKNRIENAMAERIGIEPTLTVADQRRF